MKFAATLALAINLTNAVEMPVSGYGQPEPSYDESFYGGVQGVNAGHADHADHVEPSYEEPTLIPNYTVYATCLIKDPHEERHLGGTIRFSQEPYGKTQIWGDIWGLQPGNHGFHVHTLGDLRGGCGATGGHWNPDGTDHGAASDDAHHSHAGDLAQAYADKNGDARIQEITDLDLYGDNSVIGRSLVLHKKMDDLGRGGNAGSIASGNSGPRIACCTIGLSYGPKKQGTGY